MLMRHGFVMVLVVVAVVAMNVNMGVGMGMLVGMNGITVAVFVGMGVGMLVGVLQFNGVFNHKIGADDHHNQGNIELNGRSLTQHQHTECHAKKRSDGIVSAGFGGSQILLSHHVKIDAEPISNKAKQ